MATSLILSRTSSAKTSLVRSNLLTRHTQPLASASPSLSHAYHTPARYSSPLQQLPSRPSPTLLHNPTHLQTRSQSTNFFAEFARSFRRQWQENRDLQDNVKQLSAKTNEMADSEAVQRAKKAMEAGGQGASKVFEKVGEAVDATLENPVVKKTGEVLGKGAEKVAEVTQKVAEPVLDTKAAKLVGKGIKEIKKNVVDTGSSAYFAEYVPREERERLKLEAQRELAAKNPLLPGSTNPQRVVTADPNAGTNVVQHRSSRMAEAWRKFKEDSPVAAKLFAARRSYEESDNPLVERVRDFFSSSAFDETEEAQVIRAFKQVDPFFRKDKFLKDATTMMIPEIMEAYLKGEAHVLKEWCSERAYARLTAGFEAQKLQGLISDCKLLDIRRVDIRKLTLLEDELPVALVTFTTHEILAFRNKKGELKLGKEDNVEMATYVMAFTKAQAVDPEVEVNPKTGGWLVIDWSRSTGW
ncbi:protein translocase subunit [Rhizophlyctis rosea]|uniref:Protein translocase subunit n=1 Tax=Rhizophlyctis rosea TaxID=64517 RepID=A0AAD5WXC3_9FUNG|nr:protein translocase subunit [Rhizophlyctis rosea]